MAVSLKTIDTRGQSWLKDMKTHLKELSEGNVTIEKQLATMMLDLRVQPGGLEAAKALKEIAKKKGYSCY